MVSPGMWKMTISPGSLDSVIGTCQMRFPGEATHWDASVRFDGIEAPLARNTFQLMRAALAESKA